MHRHSAFTGKDMVFLLPVLVVASVLLVSTFFKLTGGPGKGRSMPNNTQIRRVHTALVIYAQGNKSHYVGVMPDGDTINPEVGLTTQGRVRALIAGNYLAIDEAHSPMEVQSGPTSYAMLKIDVDHETNTIAKSIRNSEWGETFNTLAVVLSDRAVPVGGSYEKIRSIHTKPAPGKSDWRGSLAWNDNHVSFESTLNAVTKYGDTSHASDNLFASEAPPNNGNDAIMVWHGTDDI